MLYSLSSDFHYLNNRATDKGYVVSLRGGHSVVNADAMDLLMSSDPCWQLDSDYAGFVQQAKALAWLVPQAARPRPSVRAVARSVHLQRVQYEINLRCNLECVHCYCSSSPRAPAGLPTEFVLDVVRQAADLGVLYFDITGGEPLVRRDILPILESIRARGMVGTLFTNCTLVTAAVARELEAVGIAAVQTSLDACTPELHDRIRGKNGAFQRALRGIEALREQGIPVSVSVTLNRWNAHQAADMVRFFKDELAVPFYFDRVIPAGRGKEGERIELSNAEFHRLIRSISGGSLIPTGKVCDSPRRAGEAGPIEPACGVGATYLFLKHDGRAALCPTLTEAESPEFVQPDLKHLSLERAWQEHPTFRRLRGMQCENASVCPSGSTCRGGCRSNAYLLHGDVRSPDEMSCNIHKNDSEAYRQFLTEYEQMRQDGRLPRREADHGRRFRRFTVLG